MKWAGIGAAVVAVLASLYWFASIVRKAERAEIANQTIEELSERGKLNVEVRKLDRAGICRELGLDVVPATGKCE